ncbi:MAG: hypothetical protein RLZZ450_6035 [Pseudomonadota bacterium]
MYWTLRGGGWPQKIVDGASLLLAVESASRSFFALDQGPRVPSIDDFLRPPPAPKLRWGMPRRLFFWGYGTSFRFAPLVINGLRYARHRTLAAIVVVDGHRPDRPPVISGLRFARQQRRNASLRSSGASIATTVSNAGTVSNAWLDRRQRLAWTVGNASLGPAATPRLDRQQRLAWTGSDASLGPAATPRLDRQRRLAWTGKASKTHPSLGPSATPCLDRQPHRAWTARDSNAHRRNRRPHLALTVNDPFH